MVNTIAPEIGEIVDTVLTQLRVIRRLNESRDVSVKQNNQWVKIPSWEVVQDELDGLIAFCQQHVTPSWSPITETTDIV